MLVKLMRYEVRKEGLAQAVDAARAFVDEVKRKEGGTARYEIFQHADPPTRFTHVMAFRTPSAEDYHHKTAWSKRFQDAIRPLCAEAPATESMTPL